MRETSKQAPQKEGGEILCDPDWYVHKPDSQDNKWDDNTHTQPMIPHISKRFDVFPPDWRVLRRSRDAFRVFYKLHNFLYSFLRSLYFTSLFYFLFFHGGGVHALSGRS